MIGVVVRESERAAASEFFELFKTSWEFRHEGRSYDVILSTSQLEETGDARLVLIYSSNAQPARGSAVQVRDRKPGRLATWGSVSMPIYGPVATFSDGDGAMLREAGSAYSLSSARSVRDTAIVHLGYDLFEEVALLLSGGQPADHATNPTLELHIALLRALILDAGIPVVEVPPVPNGFDSIACLTHDVDHPKLRNHCLDHTMFGFLYRATAGSVVELLRRERGLGYVCRNLGAAARLPGVYLGLSDDPWTRFDRYVELEPAASSTWFVLPRRGYGGKDPKGQGCARRAAGYSPDEIRPQLDRIRAAGGEVALHGIDAWIESEAGSRELKELGEKTGETQTGVRMHWLRFDETSPAALDQAGFSFDSTLGYNHTVGFRAGTAQAFRPPGAHRLMELPLIVMDTALFYPCYMNLSDDKAKSCVTALLDATVRFGGAFTVNWHDRSLAPERQWDRFYSWLVAELKTRRAWFAPASRAVAWFEQRRSARIRVRWHGDTVCVSSHCASLAGIPGCRLRVHRPKRHHARPPGGDGEAHAWIDVPLRNETETSFVI